MCTQLLSDIWLFVTAWTRPLWRSIGSIGFSRQEYWSGLPFPIPGDLPGPGIKIVSPAPPALASRFFTTVPPGKTSTIYRFLIMPGTMQMLMQIVVYVANSSFVFHKFLKYFFNIFDLPFVESTDVEPVYKEGWLYFCHLEYLLSEYVRLRSKISDAFKFHHSINTCFQGNFSANIIFSHFHSFLLI